jgi:hypothetical protein
MHLSEGPGRRLRMSDPTYHTALSPSQITPGGRPDGDSRPDHQGTLPPRRPQHARNPHPLGPDPAEPRYLHHLASVRLSIFDGLSPDEAAELGPVLHRLANTVDTANPPQLSQSR